jgi:excinuclease ABC subunit C
MDVDKLTKNIDRFPTTPGVYIMKNAAGGILYIGKAVNVRSRVRSYFSDDHQDRPHIPVMLEKADSIEWIATNNETESLILEANLIRNHKPPYNVDLKDDKHFPYLKVTIQEPFPRLLVARRVEDDGAVYLGPYTDSLSMRRVMSYAKRIFKIRDCKRQLPLSQPIRPCINYSMGRCSGACAGLISPEAYGENVTHLIQFLKGKRSDLLAEFQKQMEKASQALDYELAASLRDQIRLIQDAGKTQRVDLRISQGDFDVFGLYEAPRSVCLAVLHFREGLLLGKRHFLFNRTSWETSEASRDPIIVQFYQHASQDNPAEILLPDIGFNRDALQAWFDSRNGPRVAVLVPQRGEKKQLVEMANKNARLYVAEKAPEQPAEDCIELQKACSLPRIPYSIEAFDISNLGESFAVAGMVRFVNGRPDKANYRRYKIKSVSGQDDFAMMMEAVTRRLDRLSKENTPFPDLLLIDGGKGQLHAAMKALEKFANAPMIISLAKQEQIIFSPYTADGIQLTDTHPARRLVQRVRDAVHRWAISYHRSLRGKQFKRSALEEIPGIGAKTAQVLLNKFGSVKRLRDAPAEEIAQVRGFSLESAGKLKKMLAMLGGKY